MRAFAACAWMANACDARQTPAVMCRQRWARAWVMRHDTCGAGDRPKPSHESPPAGDQVIEKMIEGWRDSLRRRGMPCVSGTIDPNRCRRPSAPDTQTCTAQGRAPQPFSARALPSPAAMGCIHRHRCVPSAATPGGADAGDPALHMDRGQHGEKLTRPDDAICALKPWGPARNRRRHAEGPCCFSPLAAVEPAKPATIPESVAEAEVNGHAIPTPTNSRRRFWEKSFPVPQRDNLRRSKAPQPARRTFDSGRIDPPTAQGD